MRHLVTHTAMPIFFYDFFGQHIHKRYHVFRVWHILLQPFKNIKVKFKINCKIMLINLFSTQFSANVLQQHDVPDTNMQLLYWNTE